VSQRLRCESRAVGPLLVRRRDRGRGARGILAMLRSFAPVLAAVAALGALVAIPLQAQDATPAAEHDTAAVCLGFAFGSWSPPLDWHAAKHQGTPDSTSMGHAPGGRGWAGDAGTDSTMMLYPGWWPVGVVVALPTRTPAQGDTVTGLATALVADGRVHNPTAKVRAWRVPCGQPNRSGAALPSVDSAAHRHRALAKPAH